MSNSITYNGSGIPFPLHLFNGQLIQGVSIDNNTNAKVFLATDPNGGNIIATVPSYSARSLSLPSLMFDVYIVAAAGATLNPTDALTCFFARDPLPHNMSSYGLEGNTFVKPIGISPTGGIYQGTGTFDNPITGLKMWADAGIGRIGGYSAGVLKWSMDALGNFNGALTGSFTGSITITGPSSGYANYSDKPTSLAGINAGEGAKLTGIEAGATVGANWATNLTGIPSTLTTPAGSGLFLSATAMGYYTAGVWKTYIDNAGNFYFSGAGAASLRWLAASNQLQGFDGATVQWYASATDGMFYAGGGNAVLNVNGVEVSISTATANNRSYKFISGGVYRSGMYGLYDPGVPATLNSITLSALVQPATHSSAGVNSEAPNNSYYSESYLSAKIGGTIASWTARVDLNGAQLAGNANVVLTPGLWVGMNYPPNTHLIHGSGYVKLENGYLAVGNYAGGAVSVGDIIARRAATTGVVYFGDQVAYMYWTGSYLSLYPGSTKIEEGYLDVTASTQASFRIRLAGQEFWQAAHTDTNGLGMILGVNRSGNRQLWIVDTANMAQNNTNMVIRLICSTAAGTNPIIDAIATDGTTAKTLVLGNATGGTQALGPWACNGNAIQGKYASGGALAGYVGGTNGLDTAAHMQALFNLVVNIRTALVNNGIMS